MEIIVNFGSCSDCDALNSRLAKKKTLSCAASGHFLKCQFYGGWGCCEKAFEQTISHKSGFLYITVVANFCKKLFEALDLQFFWGVETL